MLPDKLEHCIVFMNYWDVSGVFWSFSKCNIKIPHLPADPSTGNRTLPDTTSTLDYRTLPDTTGHYRTLPDTNTRHATGHATGHNRTCYPTWPDMTGHPGQPEYRTPTAQR